MKLDDILLKDPSSGGPSTTRSVFFYGALVCLGKLLVSGMSIKGFNLGSFGGGDFAAAIGALGAIYALDKKVSGSAPTKEE